MPWKNGGGVTTEIAVYPEGAALDTFAWRLSMASVASDGPFSHFDGIDRTLAIVEGEGLRLTIAGRAPVDLRQTSEPLAFPADVATSAELIDGTVVDLNIMTRRRVVSHRMRRLIVEETQEVHLPGGEAILFCKAGSLLVEIGGRSETLEAQDTLIVDMPADVIRMVPATSSILFLIELDHLS